MQSLTDILTTRVAEVQADFRIGVAERPRPEVPEGGALLRVLGCGVCGSDLDKIVHQKASPGSVLGHEVVGIIEELSAGHESGFQPGERIVTAHHVPCTTCHYCLNDSQSMCRQFKQTNLSPGGFSQWLSLSREHLQHTAFKVPEGISNAEASCVEPLACVLRALHRGEQAQGGTPVNGSVLIIGLGFIGLLAAQLYQQRGYRVFGTDLLQERLDLALRYGFVDGAFNPQTDEAALKQLLEHKTPLGQVDLVFMSVVNPATVALSKALVRDGGTLLAFASATNDTQLNPSDFYFRELNLITSYSPSLSDLKASSDLVFRQKLNLKPLISHRLPLEQLDHALSLYRSGEALKVLIEP